jgi:hypothetical protein
MTEHEKDRALASAKFGQMMKKHLLFMCDGTNDGIGESLQAYQAANARALNSSPDGSVALITPDISGTTDEVEPQKAINAILSGSLRMMAAIYGEDGDEPRIVFEGEAYNAARMEISEGIAIHNRLLETQIAAMESDYGDRMGTEDEVRATASMMWNAVTYARKSLIEMLRDLKRGEPPTKDDLTGLKNVLDAVPVTAML